MKLRSYALPAILTTTLAAGCMIAKPIDNLDEISLYSFSDIDYRKQNLLKGKTVTQVMQEQFTPEALAVFAEIPVVEGVTIPPSPGYAVGANIWSRIGALFTGSGWNDKVVLSRYNTWGDIEIRQSLVHEYLHHAIERDLVSVSRLRRAYRSALDDTRFVKDRLPEPFSYYTFPEYIDNRLELIGISQRIFGVSHDDEKLCHVGELLAIGAYAPDELCDVYRNVLILKEQPLPIEEETTVPQ